MDYTEIKEVLDKQERLLRDEKIPKFKKRRDEHVGWPDRALNVEAYYIGMMLNLIKKIKEKLPKDEPINASSN